MYRVGAGVALALTAVLLACGGNYVPNAGPNTLTGSWDATLDGSVGQMLGFVAFNIDQNNNTLTFSNLDVSGLGLLTPCFGAGSVMSGQLGASVANLTGLIMTLSWTEPDMGTNTMTLQGSVSDGMGTGSGHFNLAGQTSGCRSQSGSFNMSESGSGGFLF